MYLQSLRPQRLQQRCTAQGSVLRPGHVHHAAPLLRRRTPGGSTCRAAQSFELGTVYSGGKEANWLAPAGGSQAAKGVVLFMHGFAQGPNAYYENLRGLADAGLLVVAPLPPFGATEAGQQGSMVEYAAYFHSKIVSNSLTGLPLPSADVAQNIGLLAHSVGAGLATYVAQQAALQQQPFKSVMYMAPQTQVVDAYKPATAITNWPQKAVNATDFALQYGLKDDLAPPDLAVALEGQLQQKGMELQPNNITVYADGTHVGFEDQVVVGDYEVTSEILPWLNPLLLWLITALSSVGVPFLPTLLGQLRQKSDTAESASTGGLGLTAGKEGSERVGAAAAKGFEKILVNPLDIALLGQLAARRAAKENQEKLQARAPKPDGIGPPEKVEFASAEASTVQYIGLLTVAIVAAVLLAKKAFADGEVHWLPLLGTLAAGYCTYEGVYYLRLQNYVNTVQRPDSRAKAKEFFTKTLL